MPKLLDLIDTRADDWEGEPFEPYPLYWTGWVKGIDSSYEFDEALTKLIQHHQMQEYVATDSESGQIFINCKTEAAAKWVGSVVDTIEDRLARPQLDLIVDNLYGYDYSLDK